MSSIWQSYIPYHVAHDIVLHPHSDPTTREQRFEAVVCFVDVSGFTAMSEALAQKGQSGAEELTTILNSYFDPMITLIRTYGGIVGKFGGDALTALFPCTPQARLVVARQVLYCALAMQARMASYQTIPTGVGTFGLSMKIGLAIGPVFCTSIGDPQLRLEYIIAGQGVDLSVAAEHLAGVGEIVAHETLSKLVEQKQAVQRQPGFLLITALSEPVEPAPMERLLPLTPQMIATIAAYVHPTVAQRVRRSQFSFINEHRRVTIMFVRFDGFDYDDDPWVRLHLQTYLNTVLQVVQRYGGYLNKIDMGDKGSKYLVLFGTPIAHEDDEERALRCALELRDLVVPALDTQPMVQIGVNTGFVYCGQVGSPQRQEYTVMGDAVNLAARLMQLAAPGQILVSQETHLLCQALFRWCHPQRVVIYGRVEGAWVHGLVGFDEQPAQRPLLTPTALPMVGRLVEKQQLLTQLAQATQGQGQVVGIRGEAGMGKSRLVADFTQVAAGQISCLLGECQSYAAHTSYLVWTPILRELLGLDPHWSFDQQRYHLAEQLATIDPALVARMPLLQVPLNLPIADNELTQALDAELRKASLEALLVEILHWFAHKRPLCLILEDSQWIDPLSLDLLRAVVRSSLDIPLLILLLYRPDDSRLPHEALRHYAHFAELVLAELTAAEARQLLAFKTAPNHSLPPDLAEQIVDRAQGNPFYLTEMVDLLYEQEIPLTAVDVLALPDSLRSLIISRIDQLAEGPKTTLKVASAIGRLFQASWLWGSYPQLGSPDSVRDQLTRLNDTYLTPVHSTEAHLAYLFKHVITREVAYESLAVATRTMLHEQIGQFIEHTYQHNREQYLDLLAYHYGLSDNKAKKRLYFAQAAAVAQANYANEAAIDYYQRLLPLLPTVEQGAILLNLGDVYQLIGHWEEAERTYREGFALARSLDQTAIEALARQKIGALLRARGDYEEGLEWLTLAHQQFADLDKPLQTGHTLREIGIIYWVQGDFPRALAYFRQCQQLAEANNDPRGLYRAIGNMGAVYLSQANYKQALIHFEQCHEVATKLNDRLILSRNFGNIGNVYLEQGDYSRALECYAQNLQLALELGYLQGVSISIGNIGNLYLEQGECALALRCNTYNLSVALELGDMPGVGFSLWYIAHSFLCQGTYAEATRFLRRAVALSRILDSPYELCEYLLDLSHLVTLQQDYEEAQQLNAEALALSERVEHDGVQFAAQLATIVLWVRRGKIKQASGVNELRQMLLVTTLPDQQAAVHYEIWRLNSKQERDRQQAAALYHHLYAQTPKIMYRRRYQELTGVDLPTPVPLPSLPDVVANYVPNLEALIRQVDKQIEALQGRGVEPFGE